MGLAEVPLGAGEPACGGTKDPEIFFLSLCVSVEKSKICWKNQILLVDEVGLENRKISLGFAFLYCLTFL